MQMIKTSINRKRPTFFLSRVKDAMNDMALTLSSSDRSHFCAIWNQQQTLVTTHVNIIRGTDKNSSVPSDAWTGIPTSKIYTCERKAHTHSPKRVGMYDMSHKKITFQRTLTTKSNSHFDYVKESLTITVDRITCYHTVLRQCSTNMCCHTVQLHCDAILCSCTVLCCILPTRVTAMCCQTAQPHCDAILCSPTVLQQYSTNLCHHHVLSYCVAAL